MQLHAEGDIDEAIAELKKALPVELISEITLPFPPSANRLWRRSGKVIHKSAKYQAWLRDAGFMALGQKPAGLVGPYKLTIRAVRPDKRRRDLDNIIKPISDLLKSVGVIEDDCDCQQIAVRWVTSGGPVEVRVEPAGVE